MSELLNIFETIILFMYIKALDYQYCTKTFMENCESFDNITTVHCNSDEVHENSVIDNS